MEDLHISLFYLTLRNDQLKKKSVLSKATKYATKSKLNYPESIPEGFKEIVKKILSELSCDLWWEDLKQLATFNRWSFSPDLINAERFIVSRLESFGLKPETMPVEVPAKRTLNTTRSNNIITILEGSNSTRKNDHYIVSAHYDSISQNPEKKAPGAVDNASGAAAVIEMARLMAINRPQSTVVFIFYTGEEQGYHGSKRYVNEALANETSEAIRLAIILDMIGCRDPGRPFSLTLESEKKFESLFRPFQTARQDLFQKINLNIDLKPWGSDHTSFLKVGIPAILFINTDVTDKYEHYHQETDDIDQCNYDEGKACIQLILSGLAQLVY